MDDIIIIIDGQRYTMEPEVFRRMLVTSSGILRKLKDAEGSMFPKGDQKLFGQILEIQYHHPKLV